MITNNLQVWTLTSENGGNIQLTFVSFDLEECSDYDYSTYEYTDECTCQFDYVEVSYGSYSEKFCGDIVPETITSCGSGSSSMVIKFHSDSDTTGAGFKAVWEELSTCPTSTTTTTTTTPSPCVPSTCDAVNCLTYPTDNYPCSSYPDNADEVTQLPIITTITH